MKKTAAIIGVGRMGKRHCQAVKNLGMEIIGVCDSQKVSLDQAQAELGFSEKILFSDAMEMLESIRPDVLIISTTAPTHHDYAVAAAEKGIPYILCEKPLSTSVAKCEEMIAKCKEKKVKLAVNHQMCVMDHYIQIKQWVQSREMGGLVSVNVSTGNFGMSMNGIHYFEMFRFISDDELDSVTAWFDEKLVANPRGKEFEDRAGQIRILSKKGYKYFMDSGVEQGHGIKMIFNCKFGQIYVDELAGVMNVVHREEQYRDLPSTRYGMPVITKNIQIEPVDVVVLTEKVIKAMYEGDAYPQAENGLKVIKALIAGYISNEEKHRPVKIEEVNNYKHREFPWA